MFCRVKTNKSGWNFTVFLCERKRENGKVISKDLKICNCSMEYLYKEGEEHNGIMLDLPEMEKKFILDDIDAAGMNEYKDLVINKLIEFKQKYYETYKELCIEREKQEKEKLEKRKIEYKYFKEKYLDLYQEDMRKALKTSNVKNIRTRKNKIHVAAKKNLNKL